MKGRKMAYEAAKMFANTKNKIEFIGYFNGEEVYLEVDNSLDDCIVGYPSYIIVNHILLCRYSTSEEALEIMRMQK